MPVLYRCSIFIITTTLYQLVTRRAAAAAACLPTVNSQEAGLLAVLLEAPSTLAGLRVLPRLAVLAALLLLLVGVVRVSGGG